MGVTIMKLTDPHMKLLGIILPAFTYSASITEKNQNSLFAPVDDAELLRVQDYVKKSLGPKSRVEIDDTDNSCIWIGSSAGQQVNCPDGYLGFGICSVGGYNYVNCNG